MINKHTSVVSILLIFTIFSGCSIYQTASNIARLKYRIHSATEYKILGISISDKRSIKDFNSVELLKLSAGLLKGNLPITFFLNVEAKNPNDGNSGYPKTDINIVAFPWKLFLNEKEIVQGNISNSVVVPGKGDSVIIPINVEFDLAKSYKEKSLDDILLLILQIGGVKGSTSNLKLFARPVLGTSFGKIEYPDDIKIVDKTFD
jgi:hypothetical protein